MTGGGHGRYDERCGGLSFEKVPRAPKELEQMVCRGGYYPPANDTFGQGNGRERGTRETFLEESFPNPSKNLLKGYGSSALSRGILPTAKLWCILPRTQGYASIPSSSSGKIHRNFPLRGKNSARDKRLKPFDLKAKFTDWDNFLRAFAQTFNL